MQTNAARDIQQAQRWAMVRYHLGMVLKAKGDLDGARLSLERALEIGLEAKFQEKAERILGI